MTVDTPTATDVGHYLVQLVRRGPMVPCSVYLDRLGSVRTAIMGEVCHPDRIWPWCARRPVPKSEHDYRLALLLNAEAAGEANRFKPVDPAKLRSFF